MKKMIQGVMVLAALLFAGGYAIAEDGHCDGKLKDRILEKFDADGDGQLNEEERAAAKDAIKEHRGERRDKIKDRIDTDGDGEISDEERRAAWKAFKAKHPKLFAKLLEKFDADGNGKLEGEEREEARKALRKWRKHRRRGCHKGGGDEGAL
jgi:hypothetical protein